MSALPCLVLCLGTEVFLVSHFVGYTYTLISHLVKLYFGLMLELPMRLCKHCCRVNCFIGRRLKIKSLFSKHWMDNYHCRFRARYTINNTENIDLHQSEHNRSEQSVCTPVQQSGLTNWHYISFYFLPHTHYQKGMYIFDCVTTKE